MPQVCDMEGRAWNGCVSYMESIMDHQGRIGRIDLINFMEIDMVILNLDAERRGWDDVLSDGQEALLGGANVLVHQPAGHSPTNGHSRTAP